MKKKKATAENLSCEVCKFDFLATHGEIGRGYIECHHTLPISDYTSGQKTKLQDLAIVCANCHRMLHRRRPWLSITELAGLVYASIGGSRSHRVWPPPLRYGGQTRTNKKVLES